MGRPYWQEVPCPPWCDSTHEDDDHPTERTHHSFGTEEVVRLSLAEPTAVRIPGRGFDYSPLELHISVEQGYRETTPRVVAWTEMKREDLAPLEMTTAEAERLGRALLQAVNLAGGAK